MFRGRLAAVLPLAVLWLLAPSALAASHEGHEKQAEKAKGEKPVVILSTTKGDIEIELDSEKAPITVENFLQYVDDGHYDGTTFHRVIPGFMVQGGGFDGDMKQKPTRAQIKNEAQNGLKNDRGTLAMARTSEVDSATSQFFINVADNDFLNNKGSSASSYGYCVFARVTSGMEVVDAIVEVPTGQRGQHGDVPVEDVLIVSAKRK